MASELRVGVAGLGSAAAQILPAFANVEGVRLGGGADIRAEARDNFKKRFDLPAFDTVEAMCRSKDIDAVWIATPNLVHCEHTVAAAENGKHVICEKPTAVSLAECDRMVAAAERSGVKFIQGHSKIFDSPIRAMGDLIASGRLGRVIQINSWNFNDWLQRPRLPPEIRTDLGGGLVFRQGPHMIDIVRYAGGGMAKTVRAVTGRHDPNFDTEGNFSALVTFENGAVASVGFNGYGYFDITELTWFIGEGGQQASSDPRLKKPKPRRTGATGQQEKTDYILTGDQAQVRNYAERRMPFFGLTIVSCERGIIRQSPDGLYVYTENGCEDVKAPPHHGRAAELIELREAITGKRDPFPDGKWGRATLELCMAMLQSSKAQREITLSHQTPVPG
jgi:predicted dehydrogenase